MRPAGPVGFPIGVDLVEIRKARVFYETHKDHLRAFFTAGEIQKIRQSKKPHEKLAVYLAAKEAVFKALRARRAGFLGFRNIGVVEKRKKLSFRLGENLGRAVYPSSYNLSILKKKEYVVVRCAGISSKNLTS